MRKYPPIPDLIRVVTEDYLVPNSKIVLKKDLTVSIPVYAIHHDPDIYEKPEVYDPERFAPENEAKRHPYAFLPFGEGPRNCIGLRFGLMQARIGLAMLLNNFRFELSDKSSGTLQFAKNTPILSPIGGIWLKAEKL
jgi:cytochrome P450 family 6